MACRSKLPNRRPSITLHGAWVTEGAEHGFHVTAGFNPVDGRVSEVFYSDGQRIGSVLQHSLQDACVLISIALQRAASVVELQKSLSSTPVFGQSEPGSIIGAIVAALAKTEVSFDD